MQHVKSPTKPAKAEVGLWYVWGKKTPLRGFWRLRGHVKTCLGMHTQLDVIKRLGAHASQGLRSIRGQRVTEGLRHSQSQEDILTGVARGVQGNGWD
jgi:hypothetical protein